MFAIVQIAGSLFVLVAFVASLVGRLDQSGYRYLVLNAVGSGVLATTAVIEQQWGFVLLEVVWSVATLISLSRHAKSSR